MRKIIFDKRAAPRHAALMACDAAGSLYLEAGAWYGRSGGAAISGNVIADLARDGLLTVDKARRSRKAPSRGRAQLTERGKRFLRTGIDDD